MDSITKSGTIVVIVSICVIAVVNVINQRDRPTQNNPPAWSSNFSGQDKRVADALNRDCLRGKPMPGVTPHGKIDKRLCVDTVSLLVVSRRSLCTETQVLSYDGGTTPEVGCVTTPSEWLSIMNCRRLIDARAIKYHPPIEKVCLDRKREVLGLRAKCQRQKKIMVYSSNDTGMVCARKASVHRDFFPGI
jgi:hypothetical protein